MKITHFTVMLCFATVFLSSVVGQGAIVSISTVNSTDPGAYSIETGLATGNVDQIYGDRTNLAYDNVTAGLLGADYVKTANDDKNVSNFSLDVTVDKPSTLYLFHDSRVTTKPAWIAANGWVASTEDAEFNFNSGTLFTFDTFEKSVGANTTTLLGNIGGINSMYAVAAVAAVASVVPEPSALALASFGLVGLFFGRRRRVRG
jgi:hypothetical protein